MSVKKGAVDIPILIGAIIIPSVALLASIIFMFGLFGRMVDIVELATIIAYDISALSAVAYSLPAENLKIRYQLPLDCFADDSEILCLNEEVTLRYFGSRLDTINVATFRDINDYFTVGMTTTVHIEEVEGHPPPNIRTEFLNHASLKESVSHIQLTEEEGRFVIEKKRHYTHDTLSSFDVIRSTNPLQRIAEELHRAFKNEEYEITTITIQTPPSYYVCHDVVYDSISNTQNKHLFLNKYTFPTERVTPSFTPEGTIKTSHVEITSIKPNLEGGDFFTLTSLNLNVFNEIFEDIDFKYEDLELMTDCSRIFQFDANCTDSCWNNNCVRRDGIGIEVTITRENNDVTISMVRIDR